MAKGNLQEGESIDLPHCWNERDTFQLGVKYYRGWGAYQTSFTAPGHLFSNRIWRLESEGFYGEGDLWIDGQRLDAFDAQYLGIQYDVSHLLKPDHPQRLGIRLTNKCSRHTLPGMKMPDFLLYGGLAGQMRLVGLPEFHIEDRHLQVLTERIQTHTAEIIANVEVKNQSGLQRSGGLNYMVRTWKVYQNHIHTRGSKSSS